jgi:hypothetical protein
VKDGNFDVGGIHKGGKLGKEAPEYPMRESACINDNFIRFGMVLKYIDNSL